MSTYSLFLHRAQEERCLRFEALDRSAEVGADNFSCGRHECGRICCPLSYKTKSSRKKKSDNQHHPHDQLGSEGDMHDCSLTCGKLLSCGLHTCQRKDHKGPCGRCLEASYEELICHCGETIVYPPVAW